MSQDCRRGVLGQRPLTARAAVLLGAVLVLAGLAFLSAAQPGRAQKSSEISILESEDSPIQYVLTLSGTAGKETFSGVRAILTLAHADLQSPNLYNVTIVGFPTTGTRNTFYWNSEDGPMDTLAGTIHSRLAGRGIKPATSHFFYLSPVLFNTQIFMTQQDAEDRKKTEESIAKPTEITALAGELTMTATKARVTGRVVMHGLDPVGRNYVRYTASFEGTRQRGLGTKQ
jgi:hypothetical protein